MSKIVKFLSISLLVLAFLSGGATAKVSEEEAARLGKDLTPVGAEKAGNADGTIPEWTGGITKPPEGYKPGDHHPLPFPEDKPLFTITAQNLDKYKDKLTPGQIAMFKVYPETYKMTVYKTYRTASYPQFVYDASIENARNAELIENGNGFKGARVTSPFPMPKNGVEAIWNHILHYRGNTVIKYGAQAAPTRGGSYTIMKMVEKIVVDYANPDKSLEELAKANIFGKFVQVITSPARLSGTALLIHESINQVKKPRQAWTYNSGQRRVRRAPNVAYDTPGTAADGLRTTDDWDMMNGSPDRYNWELKGKKEIYIPYNTYKLHSDQVKYKDILKPGHINKDLVRYELHRVWVVEATLKKGIRHLYKKRVFYLDEDSWAGALEDIYDARDQLWRFYAAHQINYYEVPNLWSTLDCIYDLQAGRYLAVGLDNESKMYDYSAKLPSGEFTPAALRRAGK